MKPDKSEFLRKLELYKNLFVEQSDQVSRGEIVVPKLNFSTHGRYFYVTKYQKLCEFCKREPKILASFMAKRLGVSYEVSQRAIKLKGYLKRQILQKIEQRFYQDQVVCTSCGSPDTQRQGVNVYCLNCNRLERKQR